MKIVIINCHWDNRGDEAAIRAMIDELKIEYPEAEIYVQRAIGQFKFFPVEERVQVIDQFPTFRRRLIVLEALAVLFNGRLCFTSAAKKFYGFIRDADIIIHAPGGPSIGDLYYVQERVKLLRLLAVRKLNIPYVFYAPSMGPFHMRFRNKFRRKVLRDASLICVREELSSKMIKEFMPELNPIVTLDSAFQHDIDFSYNERLLTDYSELLSFLDEDLTIGITVTDLQWHLKYSGNKELVDNIEKTFMRLVEQLTADGYKILFIPQLFESSNDYDYMYRYAINDNVFVMSDKYDCYFQQYIISKLKAVIGMRYHSNIFSAKMGTPFISISYEQKMQGFMKKADLLDYCINIDALSYPVLFGKFKLLVENYNEYKDYLQKQKGIWKDEARKTTKLVCEVIENTKH